MKLRLMCERKTRSNNENWLCEHALARAFEPHDSTRTQTTITRQRSRIFRRSRCRTIRSRCGSRLRALWRKREYPVGSIDQVYSSVAQLHGFEVVRHSCMDLNPDLPRVTFDYLAEKLATTGVEAVVIDTIHFFIELVPLSMSIPYVHVWNVLHLDFSGDTPEGLN